MAMAKLAPTTPCGPGEHYQERLREIGRLAARFDSDDRHPMDIVKDFFEIDEFDAKFVEEGFQSG